MLSCCSERLTNSCGCALSAGIQAQTAECLVVGEIAAKDLVVALNKVRGSSSCHLSLMLLTLLLLLLHRYQAARHREKSLLWVLQKTSEHMACACCADRHPA